MATKSDIVFFNYDAADNNQFSNLNLNQNNHNHITHQFLKKNNASVKEMTRKIYKTAATTKTDVGIVSKEEKERRLQPPWEKKDKSLNAWNNSPYHHQEAECEKKKAQSDSTTNSSTLQLHISAYENSIEASNGNEEKASKKVKTTKVSKLVKLQDPFEYPRQMKDNISHNPEVMQFKASQKLLNPNESKTISYDLWDFADPVDILPKLPENFHELVTSDRWKERKEGLGWLLELATENVKLDPKRNYNEVVDILSKILAKDANVIVAATAAECITALARGLRLKFAAYESTIIPIILEKFKEKDMKLLIKLIETIDAVYQTTNLDHMYDELAAALGKPNPNIKIQTIQFLCRVFKTFNAQTAPKNAVKALVPLIAKCTNESSPEVRKSSYGALAAIMKSTGKKNLLAMLINIKMDKIKMNRIQEFYEEAVKARKTMAQQKTAATKADPWNSVELVVIFPELPDNFQELANSKKWQDKKKALESLRTLATTNFDTRASYVEVVETLTKILAKDVNINVAVSAAECITALAKGLRLKFAPYLATVIPVILDKFKERNMKLLIPLIETIDAVYRTTNLDHMYDELAAALGKPNPNIKIQICYFLYRVFKTFNAQTAPKHVVTVLTPLLVKCTKEADPEVREAAYAALGAIMKSIGRRSAMILLSDISTNKIKMAQIEECYEEAVQEAKEEEDRKATARKAVYVNKMLKELNQVLINYSTPTPSAPLKRLIDELQTFTGRIAQIPFKELDAYLIFQKQREEAFVENSQPMKVEKTLFEMFEQIQSSNTKGINDLFIYLESHPERKIELDRLLEFHMKIQNIFLHSG